MNPQLDLAADLRNHLVLCQEILALTERQNVSLRDPSQPSQFEFYQARKNISARLDDSLAGLRQLRTRWQKMSLDERAQHPQIPGLLRQNQDLVMRIIVLDRENEQGLLRRGLVPPRHIPPASQQTPHFVADLYRRNRLA